jgi:hypothetical protein
MSLVMIKSRNNYQSNFCTKINYFSSRKKKKNFRFFWIWEYLHIYNEVPWRWSPSLNTVSYAPYIYKSKVIYAMFLLVLNLGWNPSQKVRCGIYHLWYHVDAQKVSDLEAVWISGIRDAQPVLVFHLQVANHQWVLRAGRALPCLLSLSHPGPAAAQGIQLYPTGNQAGHPFYLLMPSSPETWFELAAPSHRVSAKNPPGRRSALPSACQVSLTKCFCHQLPEIPRITFIMVWTPEQSSN